MGKSAKLGSQEKDKEGIFRWNRAVNVFRRAAALEPFPESDEGSKTLQSSEVDISPE